MNVAVKQLATQALSLPLKQRAKLAEKLIISLDAVDTAENERLWLEEAERRYKGYKKGYVKAISASEVFRKIYDRKR